MLEMVFAVAMLAMLTAAGFGAVQYAMTMQTREQERLGAAELASRLIIIYLDDQKSLPSEFNTIPYENYTYRYTMKESKFTVKEMHPVEALPNSPSRGLSLDRFKQVTIRVWLSEETGGTLDGGPGTPSVTLTRLVDPIALRNPDVLERKRDSPDGMRSLAEEFMGGAAAPGPRGETPAKSGSTRKAPAPAGSGSDKKPK